MPSFSSTVVALALTMGALSAASPAGGQGSTYKVKQIATPRSTHSNVVEQIYKPWVKYGVGLSDAKKTALKKASQAGAAVATSLFNGTQYVIPVAIGSPPQTLALDLDTGSSDLWVMSNWTAAAGELPYNNTVYTPGPSAKFLPNYTFFVEYGDGSGALGNVYLDTVNISGVVAPKQAVEVALEVSISFSFNPYVDGLLGMASKLINTVSPVRQNTFFDNIRGTLKESLFAANLHYESPGEYDFGFVDQSSFTGDIVYSSVIGNSGFWQIAANDYAVNGTQGKYGKVGLPIVDTGTSLIYLSPNISADYFASVPGSFTDAEYGIQLFPCDETLPSLTIYIEETPFTVPGAQLNAGLLGDGSNNCVLAVQSNSGLPVQILGDAWIQSFYVVFKDNHVRHQEWVGFANKPFTP